MFQKAASIGGSTRGYPAGFASFFFTALQSWIAARSGGGPTVYLYIAALGPVIRICRCERATCWGIG
jgi:hypothetical protein